MASGQTVTLQPGEIAPGVRAVPAAAAGSGQAEIAPQAQPRPKLDIRPARPRGEAGAPFARRRRLGRSLTRYSGVTGAGGRTRDRADPARPRRHDRRHDTHAADRSADA